MAYIGKTPTKVPLTSSDIANDIINSDHIGDTAISGFSALTSAPADTDEFLVSDAGVLKRLDASLIGGGVDGISSSADANAITIDSSENVGIGTTSPGAKLEIKHGTNLRMLFDTTIDSQCTIRAQQDSAGRNAMRIDADNVEFHTATGSNTGVNRFKVGNSGEVAVNDDASDTGAAVFKVKGAQNNDVAIFIHKNTSGSSENLIRFRDGDQTTCGIITINPSSNTVAYGTSSDYRLKENVNYDFDATTRLKQLKPARFNFISSADQTVDGFLAHEVSSIVPEAVQGEKDAFEKYREHQEIPDDKSVGDFKLDDSGNKIPEYQGIDQSKLVPLLVKTIQELEARITALESS